MDNKTTLDKDLQLEISGYTRISVDTEKEDDENASIENQVNIITNFVTKHFPKCTLKIYKDRDRSGYTFEQREQYNIMRARLMEHKSQILVVKDFSRFARRNSLGLYELEQLRDSGVRIISIMDGIDYPTHDDWLMIQFRFLTNELPVTDTSKKVRKVIDNKQQNGEWLCSVPYGYKIKNQKKLEIEVIPDEAEIVREIYRLYCKESFGYKKIANYLTDKNIPTPRMKEKQRAEESGEIYRGKVRSQWSIITVQRILQNDFYIGVLRQHKYTRKKINGQDIKLDKDEHIVFEKHHTAIIDDRTFQNAQELLKLRSISHYRGVKKYDTPYSGYLFCGDCHSPMFSMSRADLAPAYTCGTYHKRGLKGCTSHHTRVDFLDNILKDYIKLVKINSQSMIEQLEKSISTEGCAIQDSDKVLNLLNNQLCAAKEELKATKKQRIRDINKDPDNIELYEETYDEIENEIVARIYGLQEQIKLNITKRNDIIEINRSAKTVFDVFDNILSKDKLNKTDIGLIVDKIIVFNNGIIDIQLKADIEQLLKMGTLPHKEVFVNFNYDSIGNSIFETIYTQKVRSQRTKAYTVNVINEGDPLLTMLTESEKPIMFTSSFKKLTNRIANSI